MPESTILVSKDHDLPGFVGTALQTSSLYLNNSSGNVGIGISNPTEQLHVEKNADTKILVKSSYTDNAWNAAGLRLENPYRKYIVQITCHNDGDRFRIYDENVQEGERITLLSNGKVGIGNNNPAYLLDVGGDINTSGDVRKSGTAYNNPDYVFETDYNLMDFTQLKQFVMLNKHLPNMPSTEEIKKDGIKIFEQNRVLLEKLEEAYLYIFRLEERINKIEKK